MLVSLGTEIGRRKKIQSKNEANSKRCSCESEVQVSVRTKGCILSLKNTIFLTPSTEKA